MTAREAQTSWLASPEPAFAGYLQHATDLRKAATKKTDLIGRAHGRLTRA
jgi:hypothetical protein